MSVANVLQGVGQYAATVPVLLCTTAAACRREPSREAWTLSAAFLVSFAADSLAWTQAQLGLNTWWVSYGFAPLQMSLLLVALLPRTSVRTTALVGLWIVAGLSVIRGPTSEPELVVEVLGCLLVVWLMPPLAFARAIRVYCLGTIPFLIAMSAIPQPSPGWLWVWGGYQIMRLVGLGLMGWAIVREVTHGPDLDQNPRGRRDGARRVGGDRGGVHFPEADPAPSRPRGSGRVGVGRIA